jgi:hypothetical protein
MPVVRTSPHASGSDGWFEEGACIEFDPSKIPSNRCAADMIGALWWLSCIPDSDPDGCTPEVGDRGVSGEGGVHPVRRPVLGRRLHCA